MRKALHTIMHMIDQPQPCWRSLAAAFFEKTRTHEAT